MLCDLVSMQGMNYLLMKENNGKITRMVIIIRDTNYLLWQERNIRYNYNYVKKSCKTIKSMIKIYYAKVAN